MNQDAGSGQDIPEKDMDSLLLVRNPMSPTESPFSSFWIEVYLPTTKSITFVKITPALILII